MPQGLNISILLTRTDVLHHKARSLLRGFLPLMMGGVWPCRAAPESPCPLSLLRVFPQGGFGLFPEHGDPASPGHFRWDQGQCPSLQQPMSTVELQRDPAQK